MLQSIPSVHGEFIIEGILPVMDNHEMFNTLIRGGAQYAIQPKILVQQNETTMYLPLSLIPSISLVITVEI